MTLMKKSASKNLLKTKRTKSKASVYLQNATRVKPVPTRAQFVKWVQMTLKHQAANGDVTIRLVNEAESAHLNESYCHKKGPTNVLAFPYADPIIPLKIACLGDIAICAPLVKREARVQKKAVIAHWAHLTIHATLHLLGYDHLKKTDARKMERVEIELLETLGFDNPY
jgi:probable rRNA maturation factor